MKKLLLLAGLAAGGFFVYRRFIRQPEDDWDWDDDTMYGSADLHRTTDAPPAGATV
jgi:hypothetical protein